MKYSIRKGHDWDPRKRIPHVLAYDVAFTDEEMTVTLLDGRKVTVPLDWIPFLDDATPDQRRNCEILGNGGTIYWPDVDEELWVRSLFWIDSEAVRLEEEGERDLLRRLIDEIDDDALDEAKRSLITLRNGPDGGDDATPYDDEDDPEEDLDALLEDAEGVESIPLEEVAGERPGQEDGGYKVTMHPAAVRDLESMGAEDQERILEALDWLKKSMDDSRKR